MAAWLPRLVAVDAGSTLFAYGVSIVERGITGDAVVCIPIAAMCLAWAWGKEHEGGLVDVKGEPTRKQRRQAYRDGLRARLAPLIRDDKGVAAVEFAIILVPMLLCVALVIDGGMAVTARQQMQSATYEAARAGAGGGDPNAVFAAGLSGSIKDSATVSCATEGQQVTCDGAAVYRNAFAGLPGVGALANLTTHAVAFKPAGGG